MNDDEILLSNLDKIHTTKMGIDRIKRNLGLDIKDVVEWCRDIGDQPPTKGVIMKYYKLAEAEEKFAEIIWNNEPIASSDLVKLCEKK